MLSLCGVREMGKETEGSLVQILVEHWVRREGSYLTKGWRETQVLRCLDCWGTLTRWRLHGGRSTKRPETNLKDGLDLLTGSINISLEHDQCLTSRVLFPSHQKHDN